MERLRVEAGVASVQEGYDGLRRLQDVCDHRRLVRPDVLVTDEAHEAVRRGHPPPLPADDDRLDRLHYAFPGGRAPGVRALRILAPLVVLDIEERTEPRDL